MTRRLRLGLFFGSTLPVFAVAIACGTSSSEPTAQDEGPAAIAPPAPLGDLTPNVTDASLVDAGDGGVRCSDYSATKNVYWGDLHSHTSLSADAYGFGTRNTPLDAYEFAMGQTKQLAAASDGGGFPWTLPSGRALDFDAITDHSEWLAVTYGCGQFLDGGPVDPASPYFDSPECVKYRQTSVTNVAGLAAVIGAARGVVAAQCDGGPDAQPSGDNGQCYPVTASAWEREKQAAAAANLTCHFTSLVAYEWTAEGPNGETLHHNVIFGSDVVPPVPFDFMTYQKNTDLWTALDTWRKTDARCKKPGTCAAITIPHNSNQSSGLAFDLPTIDGGAVDLHGLDQMARYQTLVEIHQHKGNSECYAGIGQTDGFCDFEHVGKKDAETPASFVRTALGQGIEDLTTWRDGGGPSQNPLKLGFVGATDDHNGMPGDVAEDGWPGHLGAADDTAAKRLIQTSDFNPGGITGVWAEQNTRAAIFAALTRRETFATSGPRIAVRFYQTWSHADFCASDGGTGFPSNVLAAGGVPMGGDMPAAPPGVRAPQLVVNAAKDTADLERIQIIRLLVRNGALQAEVVHDMPVTGGAPCVSWIDAGFTNLAGAPPDAAVYYARVIEKATPRWSSYDCVHTPNLGKCTDGSLPATIQERAWTSPIWWQK